jgi:hypothetical protein
MVEILGVPFSAHTRKVLVLLEEKQLGQRLALRTVPVAARIVGGTLEPQR